MELPNISHLGGEAYLLRRYANPSDQHWSAFNPSIQKDDNGDLWVVFRSSNYQFSKDRSIILTIGHKVQNRLFIGKLDPITHLFDESSIKEIDMKSIRFDIKRGIEDARLFFNGKNWCLSATILEENVRIARICVITLKSLENPEVLSFEVLPCPDETVVEKNWMPIHKTGTFKKSKTDFLHSPKYLVSKNKFIPINQPKVASKFRGGSQIISLDDGTGVGVIHEVDVRTINAFCTETFSNTKKVRIYTHRFVRVNEDGIIFQVSEPFVFLGEGVEFAAGITRVDDTFIISFGVGDIASYLASIDLGHLLVSLKGVF